MINNNVLIDESIQRLMTLLEIYQVQLKQNKTVDFEDFDQELAVVFQQIPTLPKEILENYAEPLEFLAIKIKELADILDTDLLAMQKQIQEVIKRQQSLSAYKH